MKTETETETETTEATRFRVFTRQNSTEYWRMANACFSNFRSAREGVERVQETFPTLQIKITRHYEKVITTRRHKVMKKWL